MKRTVIREKCNNNVEGFSIGIVNNASPTTKKEGDPLCRLHNHPELELFHIIEGDTIIELIDGTKHFAHVGDIVCINSNVPHITYSAASQNIVHHMIQFRADIFKKKTDSFYDFLHLFSNNFQTPIKIINEPTFLYYFETAFNYSKKNPSSRNLFLASSIYGILAHFHEIGFIDNSLTEAEEEKYSKLSPALEYISEKYNEDISLDQVAASVKMSNYYFCRVFKETVGLGFIEYLKLFRINKAEVDLIDSEKSILEIAFENGFSSASYFNRVFKETKNCSPTEYRKLLKESTRLSKIIYT